MQFPAIDDTIIAVSSGWEASSVGIVRLSGPESFELVRSLGATPPPTRGQRPRWSTVRLVLDETLCLPATAYWFHSPRSYTGQDLVELHAAGCLPVLRDVCGYLIERGARRALPGEFTARAFLFGKLTAEKVEDVLALITAADAAAVRQAGRARREARQSLVSSLCARITDLLALVEAGIDFAEEEDIQFISAVDVRARIDELLQSLAGFLTPGGELPRAGKPHVALAGRPNAGKSTLFNALVGYERAIVSPVLGTTRDVLSAETTIGGVPVVLQDCAGMGGSADELELAAHLAAEQAADQADVVLWVHAADTAWDDPEMQAAARIPAGRRLLVWAKADLTPSPRPPPAFLGSFETVSTSAATGAGLPDLRNAVCQAVSRAGASAGGGLREEGFRPAAAALMRARKAAEVSRDDLTAAELVALELRSASVELSGTGNGWLVEEILGRVFAQFCVGK